MDKTIRSPEEFTQAREEAKEIGTFPWDLREEHLKWREKMGFEPTWEQCVLLNTMYVESCTLVGEIFGPIGDGTGAF